MKRTFASFLTTALLATQLSAQHIIQVPFQNFNVPDGNFTIDTVLDVRAYKQGIGTVQKGINNRRVVAILPDSLPTYLTNYCRKYGPKTGEKLGLAVSLLEVGEETRAMSEHGFTDLEMMFLQNQNGEWKLLHEFETRIEKGGMDVTEAHGDRIWLALNEGLVEFAKLDWRNLPAKSVNLAPPPPVDGAALANRSDWAKGIYKNFQELVSNRPSLADSAFNITPPNKKNRIFIKQKGTDKILRRMIAYSDGTDVYINARYYGTISGNYFARVKVWGRYIVVDDFMNGNIGTARVLFGAIGALAASDVGLAVINSKTGAAFPLTKKTLREVVLADQPELVAKFNKMARQDDAVMEAFVRSANQELK
jgi:hypothetical protein